MPLSEKQETSLLEALDGDQHVNLWEGAVRSSKTTTSIIAWCECVRAHAPPGPLLMAGKTKDTLQRNVLDEIHACFGDASPLSHTPGSNVGTLFGRKVHMVGANDAKAESRIRGLTLAGAYVDELTLTPGLSWWSMLLTRHLTTFGLGAKEALRSGLTGLFFKRFINGLWVAAEGAIFDMLDLGDPPRPGRHRTTWDRLPLLVDHRILGLDYGTANPFHAVPLGVGVDDRLYALGEWRYDRRAQQRALDDGQYEERLRLWLADGAGMIVEGQRNVEAWPHRVAIDPSAALFRALLRSRGWAGLVAADNACRTGSGTCRRCWPGTGCGSWRGRAPSSSGSCSATCGTRTRGRRGSTSR